MKTVNFKTVFGARSQYIGVKTEIFFKNLFWKTIIKEIQYLLKNLKNSIFIYKAISYRKLKYEIWSEIISLEHYIINHAALKYVFAKQLQSNNLTGLVYIHSDQFCFQIKMQTWSQL